MAYQDFRKQKRIANEIEDLLIKYPIARDLFNKRQKRYIELWQTYLKKADKEPQPSENPLGDKNPRKMPACLKSNNRGNWLKYLQERNALTRFKKVKKDLPKYLNAKGEYDDKDFGYDSHFWHAINTEPLPPNPSEIREWDRFNKADKLCCYYAVLARLYDLEKPNALYRLCPENLDKTLNKFAYVSERELSHSECLNALDSMIKFVRADLASKQKKEAEQPTEASGELKMTANSTSEILNEEPYHRIKNPSGAPLAKAVQMEVTLRSQFCEALQGIPEGKEYMLKFAEVMERFADERIGDELEYFCLNYPQPFSSRVSALFQLADSLFWWMRKNALSGIADALERDLHQMANVARELDASTPPPPGVTIGPDTRPEKLYARHVPLNADVKRFAHRLRDVASDQEKEDEKPTKASGGETANTHSDDFRSVTWYGKPYTFNYRQSIAIKLLWNSWEAKETGVHQRTIGQAIDTSSNSYRLIDTFRQHRKYHQAWGTMIHHLGHGVYALKKPET